MKRALFIGRFQPFHKGHENAARHAKKRYDLMIGIGSAQKHGTMKNPLSFEKRKQIVSACIKDTPIVQLDDQNDNNAWTDYIEETLSFDVIISGNSLVRRLLGERGYIVEDPKYLQPDRYSGTEIRRRVVAGEEWKHLVPECSRQLLEQFGFEALMQTIQD